MMASEEPPSFRDVLNLLTHTGVATMSEMVIDGVKIERIRGRNVGYLVEVTDGAAYFVKYLHPRSGPLGVGKEAMVNRDIANSRSPSLRGALPTLLWHSADSDVLVYDAAGGQPTMADRVHNCRPSQRLARNLAIALAELHQTPVPEYPAQPPHGLHLHHPTLADLPSRSGANLQLVRLVQGNERLVLDLDEAVASWRSDAFVHGDLKFDNILVRLSLTGRSLGVRIVDWEDAGAGDARWDVGAVFGAYLAAWLTSIPHLQADSPSPLAPLARVKRETLLPSIRTFWESYAGRRQMGMQSSEFLVAAVRFAGVRLIQTASEGAIVNPLTAFHLFLLQVGANVLARPRDAMTRLLGLRSPMEPPS